MKIRFLSTLLTCLAAIKQRPKYRIIYVQTAGIDPCHWQAQRRVGWFGWRNICGRTASATTQGDHILKHIRFDEWEAR